MIQPRLRRADEHAFRFTNKISAAPVRRGRR